MAPRKLKHDEQLNAVKTWRYLRLAMVGLVFGLAVALLVERGKVDCSQGSISAYFYTPVHEYFVGALLAIGVCLFCLRGSSSLEDVLLNVAGMCATIVALVPTASTGSCWSAPGGSLAARAAGVDNNVWALLGIGLFAALVFAALALNDWRRARDDDDQPKSSPSLIDLIGFVAAFAVIVGIGVLFDRDRPWFLEHAHDIAAFTMFGLIFVVVVLNAIAARRRDRSVIAAFYAVVASLMVIAAGLAIRGKLDDQDNWVLRVEARLIALFAAFWIVQTIELWNQGLRPPGDAPAEELPAAPAAADG